MTLNIKAAYKYYLDHIYRPGRFYAMKDAGFSITGSVPSTDWEVFGALLTGEKGSPGYGTDLQSYEVKSAKDGSSFEYQYHLKSGESKLNEDIDSDHLFISYSPDYMNVVVRKLDSSTLADTFESWRVGLIENYSQKGGRRRQRYRKNVAYGFVVEHGEVVMRITNSELQN